MFKETKEEVDEENSCWDSDYLKDLKDLEK